MDHIPGYHRDEGYLFVKYRGNLTLKSSRQRFGKQTRTQSTPLLQGRYWP